VIFSYFVWLILKRIIMFTGKRITKYEFINVNDQIFALIRQAVLYAIILATGTYLIRLFNIQTLKNAFFAFIIVLFARPLNEFVKILINYAKNNLIQKTETKIDDIIFDILAKFSGFIVFSIAIILALDILGVNIMPFIAGAGIAGIAIGFAAKDTLSNIIAGMLLIIDRPYEIGDRIEVWTAPVGSATWGDVIDIGLRATKIQTTDNIIIIIPNNEIMKRDIVNYTIISKNIRVRVNIGIAYDADLKKAKEAITRVAESVEWVAKEPPPKVVVRSFGESSIDLQLRVWIVDARKRMDTISHITDKVKEEFDKEGIEIPYPKRDIIIKTKDS
ncbi:MAG: mechanosensitive ion channel family protein, partial [Desulfobacterales bacterium]|nr:mechanosensitive ion channel family protein [Desulfobacterales bacterium]